MVIFSDQHKGQGDGADDFADCRAAYHAALGYYLESGHRLFVLGDVEELWECKPAAVVAHYAGTLQLEQAFHKQGRYVRFWGNHDDDWNVPGNVTRHLGKLFGDLHVHEGLRLKLTKGAEELGEIFFAHGHQGTLESDKYGAWSRFFVRVFWRNIQRFTHWRINTPARDWQLREDHDRAMYAWAEQKSKLILITGHTHRPVFISKTHAQTIERKLEVARSKVLASDRASLEEVAGLRAELEWVRSQGGGGGSIPAKPCYFNSGCCCFDDGDITGLEIAEGMIRLVRWPDDQGTARPKVLEETRLADVLAKC
jgi:UDP-2,3-diacylglucosamine pyrophosphatase LpxH